MKSSASIARAKRYIRGEGWKVTGNANAGYVVEQGDRRWAMTPRELVTFAGLA